MKMDKSSLIDFSVCELGAILHYIKKVTEVLETESNNLTPLINNDDTRIREYAYIKRATLSGIIENMGYDYDSVFSEIERKCRR